MSDLRARAEALAQSGAAEPQSHESNSAARQLAKLLIKHPELLREPEAGEGEGFFNPPDPFSGLAMAMAEIEKQVQRGAVPIAKKQNVRTGEPPHPQAKFVGFDSGGKPVWSVPKGVKL